VLPTADNFRVTVVLLGWSALLSSVLISVAFCAPKCLCRFVETRGEQLMRYMTGCRVPLGWGNNYVCLWGNALRAVSQFAVGLNPDH